MYHQKNMRKNILIFCSVLGTSLIAPGLGWSKTYNVSPTADSNCSDGVCNFQSALSDAGTNNQTNTIQLAQGNYIGTFTYLTTTNTNALDILGGWSADFSTRSLDPTNTILDGNHAGTTLRLKVNNVEFDNVNIIAGNLKVEGVTIRNGSGIYGGGLIAFTAAPSKVEINKCIIEDNSAKASGGGCVVGAWSVTDRTTLGELYMTNNIIRNNDVSGGSPDYLSDGNEGGCGIMANGLAVISNNLIYGNSVGANAAYYSPSGGGLGIIMLAGDLYVINNTITENSVYSDPNTGHAYGGGITVETQADDDAFIPWAPVHAYLYSNIIHNNTVTSSATIPAHDIANSINTTGVLAGSSITISHCNYGDLGTDPSPGVATPILVSNITTDPQLSTENTTLYALTSPSPCIDSGLNSASHLPSTDLRGNARKWDGNGDNAAVVDMGCYEYGSQQIVKGAFSWNLFLPAITTKRQ